MGLSPSVWATQLREGRTSEVTGQPLPPPSPPLPGWIMAGTRGVWGQPPHGEDSQLPGDEAGWVGQRAGVWSCGLGNAFLLTGPSLSIKRGWTCFDSVTGRPLSGKALPLAKSNGSGPWREKPLPGLSLPHCAVLFVGSLVYQAADAIAWGLG